MESSKNRRRIIEYCKLLESNDYRDKSSSYLWKYIYVIVKFVKIVKFYLIFEIFV